MGQILIVDDDPRVRQMLQRYLSSEGYSLALAASLYQARQTLSRQSIDLVLLDLKLGHEDGLELAKDIAAGKHDAAVIILSSKDDVIDKVIGLEIGADDYVAKPFHLRELLARMKTVLRRLAKSRRTVGFATSKVPVVDDVYFSDWHLRRSNRALTNSDGEERPLSNHEYNLLDVFLRHPQRVLSRDLIMDLTLGREWVPYDRTVDTQVRRLRKKIEPDPSDPKIIKTVRGQGYMMVAEVVPSRSMSGNTRKNFASQVD